MDDGKTEQLLSCAEQLKDYCWSLDSCLECIFYNPKCDYDRCRLATGPLMWDIMAKL